MREEKRFVPEQQNSASQPASAPLGSGDLVDAAPKVVEWPLPENETAAAVARFWLGATLAVLGLTGDQIADAKLAIGELAANAVQHATPPYTLRVRSGAAVVVCEIADSASTVPRFPEPSACQWAGADLANLPEDGRGLGIVAALTPAGHGVRMDPPGKAVWFALRPEGR